MSAKYVPPRSNATNPAANHKFSSSSNRVSKYSSMTHRKHAFTYEKPPDTSSSELFPELGNPPEGEGEGEDGSNVATTEPASLGMWGSDITTNSEQPIIQTRALNPVQKTGRTSTMPLSVCDHTLDSEQTIINVDTSFAIATMLRRQRESEELNALNGYRDDYVYPHELDELYHERMLAADYDSEYESDASD
jgi:hypothetical protein